MGDRSDAGVVLRVAFVFFVPFLIEDLNAWVKSPSYLLRLALVGIAERGMP